MNEVLKLHFNGRQVRVYVENGKIEWCLSDVCDILGYAKAPDAGARPCKESGISKRYIPHPQNQNKTIEMTFINESNLYLLITRSKMPDAKGFQDWVTLVKVMTTAKTKVYGGKREEESDSLNFLYQRLSKTVSFLIAELHLTQTELAEKIGISQSVLSATLAGKRKWNLPLLHSLARFLGVKMETIFTAQEIIEEKDGPIKELKESIDRHRSEAALGGCIKLSQKCFAIGGVAEVLEHRNLQNEIVKRTKISQSTVNLIFHGKRRPTVEHAALLETILIEKGYSITRWDMLYRWSPGTPLLDLARKEQ